MEDNLTSDEVANLIPLDNATKDLANKILGESDLEETQRMIKLFNLNQAKKNVLRVIKLNSLLDKVSDQMIARFEQTPGQFSNADLLNYMQVTQSAIDRAQKALNLVDETPAITVNQVNVNINEEDTLSKESRDNIMLAVKQILDKSKELNIDLTQNNSSDENIIIEDKQSEKDNSSNLFREEE